MKKSLKTGLSFGLTSGIATTLGLMVGLYSGTHSRLAVIGGILTIAIADAASDALGIHVSEESKTNRTIKEIWEATIATFFSKFIFTLTFSIPVLIFNLDTAILISIAWGLFLIGLSSYFIAKEEKTKPWKVILEHILIVIIVIVATHFVGQFVNQNFS